MDKQHKAILKLLYDHPSLDRPNGLYVSVIKKTFPGYKIDSLLKDLKKWSYVMDNSDGLKGDHSVRLSPRGQDLMIQTDFGKKIDRIKRGTVVAAVAGVVGAVYTILSYYYK